MVVVWKHLMLNRGAELEAMDNMGCQPLHFAVLNNRSKIVRLLLDRHASVEATTLASTTPLSLACQKGHLEMVWLLVRRCPWLVVDGQE